MNHQQNSILWVSVCIIHFHIVYLNTFCLFYDLEKMEVDEEKLVSFNIIYIIMNTTKMCNRTIVSNILQ